MEVAIALAVSWKPSVREVEAEGRDDYEDQENSVRAHDARV
jgi:hypothetical protein